MRVTRGQGGSEHRGIEAGWGSAACAPTAKGHVAVWWARAGGSTEGVICCGMLWHDGLGVRRMDQRIRELHIMGTERGRVRVNAREPERRVVGRLPGGLGFRVFMP